jgi:hemolysin III
MVKKQPAYSAKEELANSITHGIGVALGIACLVLLVVFSAKHKSAWEVASCSIYGTTLILLYLASTLYHAVKKPRTKAVFKILDHSAIYLLIAGTYTPYALVPLRGTLGWSIFGFIWGCAIIGIVLKTFFTGRFKIISTLAYLVMGWAVVGTIKPLMDKLGGTGVIWLATGGICYTLGIGFYAWKSQRWTHAIWHLFVLAGSLCHFFGILFGIAL